MSVQLSAAVVVWSGEFHSPETALQPISDFSEIDLGDTNLATFTPPPNWDSFVQLFQQEGVEMDHIGSTLQELQASELRASLVRIWSKPDATEAAEWTDRLRGENSSENLLPVDRGSLPSTVNSIPEPSSGLLVLLGGSLLNFRRRLCQ